MNKQTNICNINEEKLALIAVFMGFIPYNSLFGTTYRHPDKIGLYGGVGLKFKYDTSWDWLMPVIEKIESLPCNKQDGEEYQFSITGDGVSITMFDDGSGVISSRANIIGQSKLEAAFEVVAEFVDWYALNNL